MNSLGLYVHIPFCRSRCMYCDFASTTGMERVIPAYRDALIKELCHVLGDGCYEPISSVFFGGGTPTLWDAEMLAEVLNAVKEHGCITHDAEVTIEANPGTVTLKKLSMLREAGFNRLSLGIQSHDDKILKRLGRTHTRQEADSAFDTARGAGFHNINMDLMFGIPEQTLELWEETLRWAVDKAPEHLSCYGLQLEEGTPMAKAVSVGELTVPSEEETLAMMEYARSFLPDHGLAPYEISNYALSGKECRHNIGYWTAGDYLGLGAGAYSTMGLKRWSNSESLTEYIRAIEENRIPPREEERLTRHQKMTEECMLGLRMMKGINWVDFWQRWGGEERQGAEKFMKQLVEDGWLSYEGEMLRLTDKAVPVSNAVIGKLCNDLL